ncbi:macrophage mannose receptor 1-like [Pomacea canaliculata]|uniref:macrophage mannose receptor 1-like n=1 Tax=Pomacea canaliculata TaxID=400727 RepID=UPI000D72D83B|nr:macrophage mannose receptor 1-like [Pomacea canaliculata]
MLRQRRLVAGSKQLTTRDRAAACRMIGYPGYPLTATLLVLALCLERGAGQVCPYGWYGRPGSDSCYLINTDSTKYKWPDAVDKCQAYNGQLVVISDTQERDWLFQTLADVTAAVPSVDSWWIGIKFQDSKYSWVDDTPLNNSLVPWDKGLPGDSQGPCVAIVRQKVSNYTCLNWCNLLCERFKSVPLQCDVDNKWNFINGSCFKIYPDKRTWQDAKQMCDLQDSQLAKVSSFTAHADLWDASRRLGVNLWAGLQAANNSSQLVMTWTDGSHLEATDQNFWVDGQPSLAPNTTQCMYINGGIPRRLKSWQLGDCNSLNGYTCQKPPGECQDGWLTHQSTCFKLFDDMQSWSVANLTCTGIGGQLVNLASPSDQMFLQRYLPVFASEYVDSIWIGLNDNGNDYGPITWSGGKNIGNATHWAENPPPNNTVGNLDCGFIDTSDSEGRWQLTSDCTVIRSWVCTIPVNTPVQPMPTSVSPYMCDPMWIQFGLSCYFFSDGPEIWSDARRMCKSFEADLVVITGDRDQAFLNRHVTGGDFWIGLHDIIVEGTWLWVNNNQARD